MFFKVKVIFIVNFLIFNIQKIESMFVCFCLK